MLAEQASTPTETRGLKLLAYIPFIVLIAVLIVSLINMLPEQTLRWGTLVFAAPIDPDRKMHSSGNDELVLETFRSAQPVRAAMAGTLFLTANEVTISNGSVAVQYHGISTIDIPNGTTVHKGERIGTLATKPPYAGRLLLRVFQNGREVPYNGS